MREIMAIVPCHEAAEYIGACLSGLLKAGFEAGEIVVVDDGSADATVKICRSLGVEPMVLAERTGAAAARNAGAAAAEARLLFFVDADVVVHADTRDRVVGFFARHPGHAALFGAYDDRPAHPARVSRIRNLLHAHVHTQNAGEAVTFWTGCGAVRRRDFEAIGGFDADQAMMEDVKFGMALSRSGRRISLDPGLKGTHLKRWTLAGMARTDLLHRAIPWARLLRAGAADGLPSVLNIGLASRVSVMAVAASLTAMPLAWLSPLAGILLFTASLSALVAANLGFLANLWRNQSRRDAAAALPVLWLHYLCGGLGFALVRLGL